MSPEALPPFPPLPRPLSVTVLGNSVPALVFWREGHADGGFGEVLRDELVAAGQPVVLHNEARWFGFATDALRHYQDRVRAGVPDVLVVMFGLNESQPWLLPVPLLRHFLTDHAATTRAGRWYRQHVVPPVWKQVRAYRRWAAPRVGLRTWQTHPYRLEAALKAIIRGARLELRPLVLVCDVNPPGDVLRHFLPGMDERHAVVQEVLAKVVRHADDPEVRLVRVSRVVDELGPAVALPDGMHYSPAGHAAVGRLLAREVAGWLAERDPGTPTAAAEPAAPAEPAVPAGQAEPGSRAR